MEEIGLVAPPEDYVADYTCIFTNELGIFVTIVVGYGLVSVQC